jgi:hypothetical protein
MNILIAGIVGVVMLLVGGAGYYTQYIYPEHEQQRLHRSCCSGNRSMSCSGSREDIIKDKTFCSL